MSNVHHRRKHFRGGVAPGLPWTNDASYLFNGTTGSISIANFTNTDRTDDLSISFWIKPNAWTGTDKIFDNRGLTTADGWVIQASSSSSRFEFFSDTQRLRENGPTLGTGTWKHVMYFVKNNGKRGVDTDVYIDNVLISTTTSNDTLTTESTLSNGNLSIGKAYNSALGFLGGYISQIWMWDGDESANAAAIYNGGFSHDMSLLPSPPLHGYIADGDIVGLDGVLDHGASGIALGTLTGGVTIDTLDTPP